MIDMLSDRAGLWAKKVKIAAINEKETLKFAAAVRMRDFCNFNDGNYK
jgi:hypothetical protein